MATATEAPAPAEGPTSHTHFQANSQANPGGYSREEQVAILKALREPFAPEEISTRPAIDCRACENSDTRVCDQHYLAECSACGQTVTSEHTDLDFVGHAEATARLLLLDPFWGWEPVGTDTAGLPQYDKHGGLWIRLTIAGLTRLGYGDAGGRTGGNATKEIIGDAIRNGGMRFGMALDLWKATNRTERPAPVRTPVSLPEAPTLRLEKFVEWSKTHWGHADKLSDLLRWATKEGFAESLVDRPDGPQPFGTLLETRLAFLHGSAATGSNTPPHGGQATAIGEGSQDTGRPAPGEAPDEPAHQEPHQEPLDDDTPDDTGDLAEEDAQLRRLHQLVLSHWKRPVLLEQDRTEVRRQGLLDHNVEGPPEWGRQWMRFEMLIDRRLRELGAQPATGPDQDDTDDEGRSAA